MAETMRERFTTVVGDLLDRDEKTVVVLAVISHGLFSDSGIDRRHPGRIIDVGIREQLQMGVAGGLALEGFKPIVTGYAPFLVERTFEQVKLDFDHQGAAAILASVGGSWDASESGRTHQAPEDVALMTSLRSWSVHVPGHPDEMESIIRHAHARGERTYVRMTNDSNKIAHTGAGGGIVCLRAGSPGSATVLAVGPIADEVVEAAADLDLTVLYTATPYPLDRMALRSLTAGTDVMVVEPYLAGTSAGSVMEALADRPVRLRTHGVVNHDLRGYGTPSEHRRAHGLDPHGIRRFLTAAG
jgi:transketolase